MDSIAALEIAETSSSVPKSGETSIVLKLTSNEYESKSTRGNLEIESKLVLVKLVHLLHSRAEVTTAMHIPLYAVSVVSIQQKGSIQLNKRWMIHQMVI